MPRTTLLAAGAALALLLAACGSPEESGSPSPPEADETPDAEPTPDPDSDEDETEEPDTVIEATAYFVRDSGGRLWVEPETHEVVGPAEGVARAAMEVLIAGDTRDPNLSTLAPAGTQILGVSLADGVLTLDLSGEVRGGGGSATELVFAEQLAHTATQFDTVDSLRLHVDGAAVDELWGHVDWSEPIEPDPFVLSQIDIQEPGWGEEVPAGEVTLRGESNTFEATHDLRLLSSDGELVAEDFVTATSGTGTRGTWEHTFTITEPGRWTVEAEAPDASGGEGPPPFSTVLEFEVVD